MSNLVLSLLGLVLLWAAGHVYIAHRFAEPIRTCRWRRVIYTLSAGHFFVTPTAMVMSRLDYLQPFHVPITWVGYISAGAFALLVVLTVIKDLGVFGWHVTRGVSRNGGDEHRQNETPQDPERRRLMKLGLNGGVLAATATATQLGVHQARKIPDVMEVTVPMPHLPPGLDGFQIAQISDLHVGETIRRPTVEAVVRRTSRLNADMVALTGDLVEGYPRFVWDDLAPLFELDPPHGLHYVTGNHEYYWGARKWCDRLKNQGLEVLLNDHVVVEHQGARLLVAGCTDYKAGDHIEEHASDPQGALRGAPDHDVSLLLAHQPTSISEAAKAGYNLQLSGHTHGGQFWPWNYIAGMYHRFSVGLGRQDDTWIYVSRGTGYWGPPVRLAAPSEITLLTLRRGGPKLASEKRLDQQMFENRYA